MKAADQLEQDFGKANISFGKMQGISELNVMLLSILYLNEEPLPIETLSKKTGYSLSTISTAMKTLELLRKVNKVKIPGDKKVYYEANRDVVGTMKQMFSGFKELHDLHLKQNLPKLMEKYGTSKDKAVIQKLKMLKLYESQLKQMGRIMEEMLEKLEAL